MSQEQSLLQIFLCVCVCGLCEVTYRVETRIRAGMRAKKKEKGNHRL